MSMSSLQRRLIFIFSLVLFFIAAPIVILLAQGYSLTWHNGLKLQKNGFLIVDSVPQGARIFLNDRDTSSKTPARFTTLKPGTYTLRLNLPGSLPWESAIEINPNVATFADQILLMPKNSTVLSWQDQKTLLTITTCPTSGLLAGLQAGNPPYLIVKTPDGQTKYQTPAPFTVLPTSSALSCSAYNNTILLNVREKDGHWRAWVKNYDTQESWQELNSVLPKPIQNISWAPDYDDALLFRTPSLAGHLFLPSLTVVPITSPSPLIDILIQKEILSTSRHLLMPAVAQKQTLLKHRAAITNELTTIATLPNASGWRFIYSPAPSILAQNQKDNLIYYWPKENETPQIYQGNGASLDPNGGILLIWTDRDIRVIYTKEQRPDKHYKPTGPIQQVFWFPKTMVALLVTSNTIHTLTLAPDSLPNYHTIFTTEKIIEAHWLENTKQLFLLTQKQKQQEAILLQLPIR